MAYNMEYMTISHIQMQQIVEVIAKNLIHISMEFTPHDNRYYVTIRRSPTQYRVMRLRNPEAWSTLEILEFVTQVRAMDEVVTEIWK